MLDLDRLTEAEFTAIIAKNTKINEFDLALEDIPGASVNVRKIKQDIRTVLKPKLVEPSYHAGRNQEL